MEPQGEMRDDEREVLFLSSDDDGVSCPQSKRQRSEGSRYCADKMKIHRWNHKLSCMVRGKTDDLEQRRNFFKGPRLHYVSFSYCGSSLQMWGPCHLLRRCRLTCTEPLSMGGRVSSTLAW